MFMGFGACSVYVSLLGPFNYSSQDTWKRIQRALMVYGWSGDASVFPASLNSISTLLAGLLALQRCRHQLKQLH